MPGTYETLPLREHKLVGQEGKVKIVSFFYGKDKSAVYCRTIRENNRIAIFRASKIEMNQDKTLPESLYGFAP